MFEQAFKNIDDVLRTLGLIACDLHIPFKLSDTWNWERWEAVPEGVHQFNDGTPIQCESCAAKARRREEMGL